MHWDHNNRLPGAAANPLGGGSYTYGYDQKYQLTGADFSATGMGTLPTGAYGLSGLSYDLNGNIQGLKRNKADGTPLHDFTGSVNRFHYKAGTNQLDKVPGYADYTYNKIGQLVKAEYMADKPNTPGYDETQHQAHHLHYNPYGKLDHYLLHYGTDPSCQNCGSGYAYRYDERGQRVLKENFEITGITNWDDPAPVTGKQDRAKTFYLRAPSGSLTAVYTYNTSTTEWELEEVPIYGATGRLGVWKAKTNKYLYEIKDHLGNVRVVFDRSGNVENYAAYYPFGLKMAEHEGEAYRWGYQGEFSEEDGESGLNSFIARQYDPVIGRWLIVDPAGEFWSPYVGMGNDFVNGYDANGEVYWKQLWLATASTLGGVAEVALGTATSVTGIGVGLAIDGGYRTSVGVYNIFNAIVEREAAPDQNRLKHVK